MSEDLVDGKSTLIEVSNKIIDLMAPHLMGLAAMALQAKFQV